MHLAEEHFLGRPVLSPPGPYTSFQRPPLRLPVTLRLLALQPLQ